MGEFFAISDELRLAQSAITDVAADLSIGVEHCAGEVDSLLSSSWSGSAAAGFASAWTEWQDGASKVAAALARCGAALAESAAAYASTDVESSASLNRISGLLS